MPRLIHVSAGHKDLVAVAQFPEHTQLVLTLDRSKGLSSYNFQGLSVYLREITVFPAMVNDMFNSLSTSVIC